MHGSAAKAGNSRRHRSLRIDGLSRLQVPVSRVLPFVVLADHRCNGRLLDAENLKPRIVRAESPQLPLAL